MSKINDPAQTVSGLQESEPKGKGAVAYTLSLNYGCDLKLPENCVESVYAPEMFAETPSQGAVVKP